MILNGFKKKSFFQNRYVALQTPSRPLPFMGGALHGKYHLKFPFWLSAHLPNNEPKDFELMLQCNKCVQNKLISIVFQKNTFFGNSKCAKWILGPWVNRNWCQKMRFSQICLLPFELPPPPIPQIGQKWDLFDLLWLLTGGSYWPKRDTPLDHI